MRSKALNSMMDKIHCRLSTALQPGNPYVLSIPTPAPRCMLLFNKHYMLYVYSTLIGS